MTAHDAMNRIRAALSSYAFVPHNEAELQSQVSEVLASVLGVEVEREVVAERGRYDIMVRVDGFAIVLELKVKGSANQVERQAQKYALTDGVDAVAVVTTKQRLASDITASGARELGGKPFAVIALRGF